MRAAGTGRPPGCPCQADPARSDYARSGARRESSPPPRQGTPMDAARRLGRAPAPHARLWSAVAVLVGTTIGSGIFRVPAGVAGTLGEPGPDAAGLGPGRRWSRSPGRSPIAELAAALPRSGGVFAYILEAFGPLPAFLFGWSELTVIRASALGGIATIFAEYLGYFVHFDRADRCAVRGGERHRRDRAASTTVGRPRCVRGADERHHGRSSTARWSRCSACSPSRLGNGSAAHFTPRRTRRPAALDDRDRAGADHVDLRRLGRPRLHRRRGADPGRNLPRALILGTLAIVAIYLLLNAAYLYLVPVPEMAASELVAATAAERIPLLGGAGGAVVSAIVMVSCFGTLNGSMMTGPRIFFAMADRGLFFPVDRAGVAPVPDARRWRSGWPPRSAWPTCCSTISSSWPIVRARHLAVLRAGGRRRLRPPADAPRPAAPLPDVGLSGDAGALPARLGRHGGQRPRHRPGEHRA